MKLIIEFINPNQLMDCLMEELPQLYVDLHSNKKSGGNKIKWEVKDE